MGGRQRRHGGAVTLVVAVALALSACGDGAREPTSPPTTPPTTSEPSEPTTTLEPSPEPTTEPTVEPSEDPTEDPTGPPPLVGEPKPEKPAELSEFNATGAEAFVQYAVEVLNYAQRFNLPDEVREISDPECAFCNSHIATLEAMRDEGVRQVGGDITFVQEEISFQPDSGLYFLDGELTVGEYSDYGADGTLLETIQGETVNAGFAVGLEDGTWRIYQAGSINNE
ncbi:MAG TPA: hypothetical protein GX743_01875 [Actinomycetales bacterium]|nr:hypothetical protein [Actinomycetales bacterium]